MSTKKRLVALLLMAAMTISLVACGKTGSDVKGTKGEVSTEKTGPLEAYKEPVTITIGHDNRVDPVYKEGDDVTSNPWTRAYLEKLNINLESAFQVDSADYNTKINLSIAEMDLPDVFYVDKTQLLDLVEADLIYDMTEVYDDYASDLVKSYMAADQASYESGLVDGKMYGIAKLQPGELSQPCYVWIRKDWKEALDLADPKTMDDLVTIMKAFVKEYGSKGLNMGQGLDELKILGPAWGAYYDFWLEDEETGDIVYGSIQPEMKEALAAFAEWYKEGIIDPNFITTDWNKQNEDTVTGKVGVTAFYQWWGYTPGPDVVSNLGAEAIFEPYEIPAATVEKVMTPISCSNQGYIVVNKECKNPEAVIKLINLVAYLKSAEAAEKEDKGYLAELIDNGMEHASFVLNVANPNSESDNFKAVRKAIEAEDPSLLENARQLLIYNDTVDFLKEGKASAVGNYLQQGAEKSAYGIGNKMLEEGRGLKNVLWGVTPPTMLKTGSTLSDILIEGFTKIIAGEENIDYFDTLVADWKAAGGESAIAEMNEIYGD